MPATNPALLLEPCYLCLGLSQFEAMQLSLWDSISQSAATDPVADFIARAGITDQTQIDAVQALHDAAVTNGWWSKCDLIYPFVGGTAQAHAQNLKSANFTITWNGTVTHDADGITGNGVDGYGDTGYIPSSSGQLALDSAHVGIYRRTTGIANCYIGVSTSPDFLNVNRQAIFATNVVFSVNDINGDVAAGTSLAWLVASRTDNVDKHTFSGSTDFPASMASSSIPALPIFILAFNNDGTPDQRSNANLAGATAGSGLTFAEFLLMEQDWQTFETSLGRNV